MDTLPYALLLVVALIAAGLLAGLRRVHGIGRIFRRVPPFIGTVNNGNDIAQLFGLQRRALNT